MGLSFLSFNVFNACFPNHLPDASDQRAPFQSSAMYRPTRPLVTGGKPETGRDEAQNLGLVAWQAAHAVHTSSCWRQVEFDLECSRGMKKARVRKAVSSASCGGTKDTLFKAESTELTESVSGIGSVLTERTC